ncbi:MAG: hypothetical protein V2A67_08030 [Bacteroidota bacterium]
MTSESDDIKYIDIQYGQYLSSVLKYLPSGRINKNVTGAGATTLEIVCDRPSLIVFPTRALAATKAFKHSIHYIGSDYPGITRSDEKDIIKEISENKIVKVAVVADSLMKFVERVGEITFQYFHLTIDEADSFQSEVSYRPKLQECIDIYIKFPTDRRTLVSATLKNFSSRELAFEKLTNIEWLGQPLKELQLVHVTGDFLSCLVENIKIARGYHFEHKLLVAYNSIEGILEVIEQLKGEYGDQIGVLCSEQSKERIPVEFQGNLTNSILSKPITFITSAYFLGIDIDERLNIIIAANVNRPHTLISIAKIQQVLGRARKDFEFGMFVFNTLEKTFQPLEQYREELQAKLKLSFSIMEIIQKAGNSLISPEYSRNLIEGIVLRTTEDGLPLIRKIEDYYGPCHLHFDYLLYEREKIIQLYSEKNQAEECLLEEGYFLETFSYNGHLIEDQKKIQAEYQTKSAQEKKTHAINILFPKGESGEEVLILTTINSDFEKTIADIKTICGHNPNLNQKQIYANLKSIIEEGMSQKALNNLRKKVLVYNQDPSSLFWRRLREQFTIGESYDAGVIHSKMLMLRDTFNNPELIQSDLTPTSSVQWVRNIFNCSRRTDPGKNRTLQKITLDYWSEMRILPQAT